MGSGRQQAQAYVAAKMEKKGKQQAAPEPASR
jgi:hypothetical protein